MKTKFILNITKGKVLFFMILFFCLFPMDVMGKESLGTCVYELDTEQLALFNQIKDLRLTVTIYDDKSTGERKFLGTSVGGDSIDIKPKSNIFLPYTSISLKYSKMFDKNGKFYKAYEERNNCPTMQFINDMNILEFYVNGNHAVTGSARSQTITPDVEGGTSDKPTSPKVTYCNNRIRTLDSMDVDVSFTTTEQNGIREFTIEVLGNSNTVKYNEINAIGDYAFQIREEDYDTYWSDSCEDANFYIAGGNVVSGEVMTIQTVEPEDWDDAAGEAEWEYLEQDLSEDNFNKPGLECPDIINMEEERLGWLLNMILNYIKIIGPVLVVILSSIDFIKAVIGTDEKAMKEAQSKLIIRLVAAIALFLVPTLVQLLLSFINATTCTLG